MRNSFSFLSKYLERKLDVFHLAYIRHKVEIELSVFSSEIEDHGGYQTQMMEIDQRTRHRWNPLGKVKNKFNQLNKGDFHSILEWILLHLMK